MHHIHRLLAGIVLIALLGALPAAAQDSTPTPPAEDAAPDYLLAWPVAHPTDEMLNAARDCAINALVAERYPETLALDEIADAFAPETACDWAVLAAAYGDYARNHDLDNAEDFPEAGIDAFKQAVALNPVIALRANLMGGGYFATGTLVEPPPHAEQAIAELTLHYDFSGIGGFENSWIDYTIRITDAAGEPVISGTIERLGDTGEEIKTEATGTVDPALIQALGPALDDLLPIGEPFEMLTCYDIYSDWEVTLTFDDDTTISLATHDSNFMYIGGPWQAVIDGKNYMQYSGNFVNTLSDLIDALALPWGESAAWSCFWPGDPLEFAYPAPATD